MSLKEIFETGLFRGEIRFNEPMSAYTSLKIGGPVEAVVFPEDPVSLRSVLIAADNGNIPFFVFGAGTNLLVRDGGVNGIGISLKSFSRIEPVKNLKAAALHELSGNEREDGIVLFVEAGASLGNLISYTKQNGYSGIEALAGIPGTFGGAVFMNAGSFGTEIKDVIASVALIGREGKIEIVKKDKLNFSYRCSNIADKTLILSANIVLRKDSPESVGARISEFLKKKRLAQPLGESSAGCVFKNPAGTGLNQEGVSAGRLIEKAGCKGMRAGDVEVSTVHANYFINRGLATCKDFIKLMNAVQAKVKDFSGITLEPEIRIIGKEE